jgi:hypothetical protein
MPVQPCQRDGKPGYRWGEQGTCYTYTPGNRASQDHARAQADAQGRAIQARQGAEAEADDE